MDNFIKLGALVAIGLALMSCESTGTEEPIPDLKEILPNTTWYSVVQDSSDIYTQFKFGDLNTEIIYTIHDFPCGSTPNHTLEGIYTLIDKKKVRLEFIYITPGTSEHEIIHYSDGKIALRKMDDGYQTTLYRNCYDMP